MCSQLTWLQHFNSASAFLQPQPLSRSLTAVSEAVYSVSFLRTAAFYFLHFAWNFPLVT